MIRVSRQYDWVAPFEIIFLEEERDAFGLVQPDETCRAITFELNTQVFDYQTQVSETKTISDALLDIDQECQVI